MIHREQDIIDWATARNIIGPNGQATKDAQAEKTGSELSELFLAIENDSRDEAKDAIGDIYVTIAIQAAMWGLTMEECIEQAWDDIKDRTGMMIHGKFVKQHDLDILQRAGFSILSGKVCGTATTVSQRDHLISAANCVELRPNSEFVGGCWVVTV